MKRRSLKFFARMFFFREPRVDVDAGIELPRGPRGFQRELDVRGDRGGYVYVADDAVHGAEHWDGYFERRVRERAGAGAGGDFAVGDWRDRGDAAAEVEPFSVVRIESTGPPVLAGGFSLDGS